MTIRGVTGQMEHVSLSSDTEGAFYFNPTPVKNPGFSINRSLSIGWIFDGFMNCPMRNGLKKHRCWVINPCLGISPQIRLNVIFILNMYVYLHFAMYKVSAESGKMHILDDLSQIINKKS